MKIKHLTEYRNRDVCQSLIGKIHTISQSKIRIMEVCGTHTMAISRNGIRQVLPPNISLLSGPGCPVCVTAQNEIDKFIQLARIENVIITTFGDLMRVPGSEGSLLQAKADGADVRVVYSPFDSLEIAQNNPSGKVVFLGVGFETTAPTVAATIKAAFDKKAHNFWVISAHKLVPPALETLLTNVDVKIDGFLCPGHVSVIIGAKAYEPIAKNYKIPCVIAGFEPTDILDSIAKLVELIETKKSVVDINYRRGVSHKGNPKALSMIQTIFQPVDAEWRGLGIIPGSGLEIRKEYEKFDANREFNIAEQKRPEPKGCICGQILTGIKIPPECNLFGKKCIPENPVGPCMVSSEGTCAAYFKYQAF